VAYFSVLEMALQKHFSTNCIAIPKDTTFIYKIDDMFTVSLPIQSTYLKAKLKEGHFSSTMERGALYRPDVTNGISRSIDTCLKKAVAWGLMINGPYGIGKSHSIVNVVWKLMSTGDFLVTYIPNCEHWETTQYLVDTICASFGLDCNDLRDSLFKQGNAESASFRYFVEAIDAIL
jgi:hypothetical protein